MDRKIDESRHYKDNETMYVAGLFECSAKLNRIPHFFQFLNFYFIFILWIISWQNNSGHLAPIQRIFYFSILMNE